MNAIRGLGRSIGRAWPLFRRSRPGVVGLAILAFFVLLAFAGPFVVGPIDGPGKYPLLLDPSAEHLFGTDRAGRDLFRTFVQSAQVSMIVGIVASALSMVIGATVGIVAGFTGGRTDGGLMRVTDLFYVLPTLVLAVVLTAILGPSMSNVILVIAITSWPGTARIIRAQTLSVRQRAFIARARAYGAGNSRIMLKHVLPNVFSLILANTTLTIGSAIFLETTLSFLGVGVKDTWSWGRMLEESFSAGALTLGKWVWFVPPGLAVVLVIVAFTLMGQAFDEILDPRLRRRDGADRGEAGPDGDLGGEPLGGLLPVAVDQR
ncbi:MAG: peptide/nickel transport system permease protein [Chloroflexota bacterium]|jgi:peptide/nickel transport system permease protein|nr:peptide/nickel transport system permease protein [Chloroflexota bacterium]